MTTAAIDAAARLSVVREWFYARMAVACLMVGSIAANNRDGSFRPSAAYADLIVSTADILVSPRRRRRLRGDSSTAINSRDRGLRASMQSKTTPSGSTTAPSLARHSGATLHV